MSRLIVILFFAALAGCAYRPQDGGGSSYRSGNTAIYQDAPDNAKTPSRTQLTREWNYRPVISAARPAPKRSERTPAHYREVWTSETGTSWKDEAAAMAAKFANLQPVQYVGISMVIGSVAAFYFGWITPGIIMIVVGAGMIAAAHFAVAGENLIITFGLVGAFVAIIVVVYAYNKGALDQWLPDKLDKNE